MNAFGSKVNPIANMFGKTANTVAGIVSNTSYMDFLANMSGINIAQQEPLRAAKMFTYLTKASIVQTPSRMMTQFDQAVSRQIAKLWDFFLPAR